jgi:hypothetical protein
MESRVPAANVVAVVPILTVSVEPLLETLITSAAVVPLT